MVPIVLVLELVLVLDFVQRQEHFWPASCVSESSSLCLSQRATHGKGWSLRLRLSAFGLRPTPTRPSADTLLELVLDFVQRQEHIWPARRVSEGSSLCLSLHATHGKGWSLRLRLSAFGLRPTPTRPSADPPTRFSRPRPRFRPTARALLARIACKRRLQPLPLMARHARQRLEPSLTLERVWPLHHADTPIRRPADTLLELVLDFVQQQEHFWPARRVSEGSSLCLSWHATHGKAWSLRLRLSAFGLCPTPTRPSADPPTRFSRTRPRFRPTARALLACKACQRRLQPLPLMARHARQRLEPSLTLERVWPLPHADTPIRRPADTLLSNSSSISSNSKSTFGLQGVSAKAPAFASHGTPRTAKAGAFAYARARLASVPRRRAHPPTRRHASLELVLDFVQQ